MCALINVYTQETICSVYESLICNVQLPTYMFELNFNRNVMVLYRILKCTNNVAESIVMCLKIYTKTKCRHALTTMPIIIIMYLLLWYMRCINLIFFCYMKVIYGIGIQAIGYFHYSFVLWVGII